ncbi:Acid_phosphatase [Hexamita inflata]|uniref:Acid phosphatase n=1 Tax=Hexamita inflata TaxID=28002 RepID=A0AA86NHH9_9EUKA|nr:Acid phosphatase [Hexamita inflata]
MTRHGIRTPLKPFPRDPGFWSCASHHVLNFQHNSAPIKPTPGLKLHFDVKNAHPGSCFSGQLADNGYQQHLDLSNLWSKLYSNIGHTPSIRSTAVHRVRLSLNGQLNNFGQFVNNAQIAVQALDSAVVPDNCSWDQQYKAYTVQNMNYQQQELDIVRELINWKDVTWQTLGDNFKARRAMNVEFPKELSQEQIQMAIDIENETFRRRYYTNTDEALRNKYLKLTIGPYMEDLIYLLQTKKFHITSAHDTSVGPLAGVLIEVDQTQGQCLFASFLNVEVWETDGQDMIKIKFRNGSDGEGAYHIQKACGKITCTKDEFLTHINKFKVSVREREQMCNEQFVA